MIDSGPSKEAVDRGSKKFKFRPMYMVKFLLSTRSRSDLTGNGAKNFFVTSA